MGKSRVLRRREKINFIKFIGGMNKDDIEIIWGGIVPKMPKNCIFINKGKATINFMEKMGEFITKDKFAEIKANPRIICKECQFHSVCEMSKDTKN